ncbi:hypothetical protein LOCC1_G007028 [Lachnellula occidentalis]|uniref:Zn(2)-C6 fungal-type domain-containing protein n=1 Tax=Lachnellula occidentalis TaxID=215460 RepID=A0A8H8UJ03_9HELO|nr:hypothetical protein LOCC1_G007028 [Lachnellula occidentalis]
MVFRGVPSKACQRCRDRRLKCDLRKESCSSCLRAVVPCSGYRDTRGLRIADESKAVQKKAISRKSPPSGQNIFWLPVSLEGQARDAFFVHYVAGTTTTWDFLRLYYSTSSSNHLALSIDAASLAYLAHEMHSETALAGARKKYVSALRTTSKAVQSPGLVAAEPTLLASLVLDLFEKITNADSKHNGAWKSHVNGALALVRLRGLDQFQDPSALKILVRLSTNFIITAIASGDPVPNELGTLRAYVGKQLHAVDPKWHLTDLMIHYANLRANILRGIISIDDYVRASLKLDSKLQSLSNEMPASWIYTTTILDHDSEGVYERRFDSYTDRHVTQTWNVLRLIRILLNQSVLQHCLGGAESSITETVPLLIQTTCDIIIAMARDICASVPQYVKCKGTYRARHQPPPSVQELAPSSMESHNTPGNSCHINSASRLLDVYTLIFSLYIVGDASSLTHFMKPWVITQLHYIGEHYGIRNAELVARILEKGKEINPWSVYTLLGSYAFVA